MRLRYIKVENFRCIETAELHIEDYISLIGPNNSGKSSLLRAAELALSGSKPSLDDWRFRDYEKEIAIELIFTEIEEDERDIPGIAGLIHNDQIHLRMRAIADPESRSPVKVTQEAKTRIIDIDGWATKWSELSEEIKSIATDLGVDGKTWRTKANQERVRSHISENYPNLTTPGEEIFSSESISIPTAIAQGIPEAIYIPAVRDASDELKPTSKTAFGLLLEKVLLPAIRATEEFTSIQGHLLSLQAKLGATDESAIPEARVLASRISERLATLVAATANLVIEDPELDKALTSSFSLSLDDGMNTPVQLQGHGLQRALIFALIEALAIVSRADSEHSDEPRQRPVVLLFEEPELFIHPHLMRKLREVLRAISRKDRWQVLMTTHSPFLVDVGDNYRSLVIVTREGGRSAPRFRQLDSDPFSGNEALEREQTALRATLDFHPTTAQAFFGQTTVLVEGPSELAVLQNHRDLLEACDVDPIAALDISIVSCGGKWTIPAIARLLINFELPVRVVHDRDLKQRTVEELAKAPGFDPYNANERIAVLLGDENIFVCEDTLEHLLEPDGQSVPKGSKPFEAWLRAREISSDAEKLQECTELRKLVRFVYQGALKTESEDG